MAPHQPVRFELDEPLIQTIPLARNVRGDVDDASISYHKQGANPERPRTLGLADRLNRRAGARRRMATLDRRKLAGG
jgi:hypothetical protein